VALIAIDPHTGEVKTLVGGRNYGASQLNHRIAMRQPGSVFQPSLYAAALETANHGGQHIFNPASVKSDKPTAFYFDNQVYQHDNFNHQFMGDVVAHRTRAFFERRERQLGATGRQCQCRCDGASRRSA